MLVVSPAAPQQVLLQQQGYAIIATIKITHAAMRPERANLMQVCNPYEILIQGMTNKGKRFRPSDWSERLSGILSSFNTGRLSYHQFVRPLLVDNVSCVAVDKKLAELHPEMFQFLMDFAQDNDLRLIDCKDMAGTEANLDNNTVAVTPAPTPVAALAVVEEEAEPSFDIKEILPPDTALAYNAIKELRVSLVSSQSFSNQVDNIQRGAGYRLFAVFVPEQKEAVAVCGFRLTHNLVWGRYIHIDDLVTQQAHRRQGYAKALLDAVTIEAKKLGCTEIHLNAYVLPERAAMHRLCYNNDFFIASHHFRRSLA